MEDSSGLWVIIGMFTMLFGMGVVEALKWFRDKR